MKKPGLLLKKVGPSLIRILQLRFEIMIEYIKQGKSDTQKIEEERENNIMSIFTKVVTGIFGKKSEIMPYFFLK